MCVGYLVYAPAIRVKPSLNTTRKRALVTQCGDGKVAIDFATLNYMYRKNYAQPHFATLSIPKMLKFNSVFKI